MIEYINKMDFLVWIGLALIVIGLIIAGIGRLFTDGKREYYFCVISTLIWATGCCILIIVVICDIVSGWM